MALHNVAPSPSKNPSAPTIDTVRIALARVTRKQRLANAVAIRYASTENLARACTSVDGALSTQAAKMSSQPPHCVLGAPASLFHPPA